MIAVEQKIDSVFQETENSVNVIIEGSDEHLDLILSITQPLNHLTASFQDLNEYLFDSIGTLSRDQLQDNIMPRLMSLNKSCMTLVGSIRTSLLYRDVRESLKNYSKQHDILREIIHDIHYLILPQNDKIDDLLKAINEH